MTNTTIRSRAKRIGAAAGAVALGLAGVFASALPASAAPNIDTSETGSIVIHKFEEPSSATNLPNDGSALTEAQLAGLTPLAGVQFTAQQVTSIDLTDNAGWDTLDGLTADDVLADSTAYPLGTAATQTTSSTGLATFGDLPIGVYLVTETDPGANPISAPAKPFLVSIPLPINNSWLYDVNVYPKNTVTDVTKTVDDSDAHGLGDTVTFTVGSSVPSLPAGQALTQFGLTDAIDSRLAITQADIEVAVEGLDIVATDYTVAVDANNLLTVAFTEAGIAKLATVPGAAVTLTIPTVVNSIGDGTIENTASVYVNDPDNSFDSNEVVTSWGALKVVKYAADDESLLLAGAEFQIYLASDSELENPIAVKGQTTFVTGSNGELLVEGLKVGDYQLVETKAPLGYVLDADPIDFTITAGSVTDAVTERVANSQTPPVDLPLTGSTGTILFVVVGGALLAIAAGMVIRSRAKRA